MPNAKNTIEPAILKGFQDFFPEDLLARRQIIRTIERVFELYGFVPLETPAIEYLETLLGSGGDAANKELFRLESPEGEAVALRFDLTVPFARMIAQYPDRLKPPVRRYAIGPVWRADKPGPGRFRQFVQCDADIAGAANITADAEIIALMAAIMDALGARDYAILINNRRLIDALLDHCGIVEKTRQKHVLRVIDKCEKVGVDNVRRELGEGRIDESGDPIPGVRLDEKTIDAILALLAIAGDSRADTVAQLADALPDTPAAREALQEMRELADILAAIGIPEAHARFEPSLARGLDYYTGPVFEAVFNNAREFGSVMGGGRYDGLTGRFADRAIPCTGTSVGLDRFCAALKHLGLLETAATPVQVLVVTIGNVPKAETMRLAAELRAAGIRTETYFAARKKMQMSAQLSHADHYGIPVAVIIGEDELARGLVSVKDLRAGKAQRADITDRDAYRQAGKTAQVTIPRTEMVAEIQRILIT